MNTFYIYLHIRLSDGQPFYVGKGSGKRAFNTINRSLYWKKIVNKHGFDVIFLEENLTEKKAFELEKYWIRTIGRLDQGKGPLVNFTDGGDGISGHRHTDEVKKKIGILSRNRPPQSQETRDKISKLHKGKIVSDSIKLNMSIANRKRFQDDPTLSHRMVIKSQISRIRKKISILKDIIENL